jgi:hypothetical protein
VLCCTVVSIWIANAEQELYELSSVPLLHQFQKGLVDGMPLLVVVSNFRPIAYSERCRSAFRSDADRDSKLMPITIPK